LEEVSDFGEDSVFAFEADFEDESELLPEEESDDLLSLEELFDDPSADADFL
jgi:hypothetical protein